MRLPKNITIDWDQEKVFVDGEEFDIAIDEFGPVVVREGNLDRFDGDTIGCVLIPVLCETSTVVGVRKASLHTVDEHEHSESSKRLA